MVEQGLAPTRQKAQALVMAGRVQVDGVRISKPGMALKAGATILTDAVSDDVGRGALKLRPILTTFGINAAGRVALDVGASTGGFTQVLLEAGAARVHAVDVGRGQLHERLRTDRRVVIHDRVNARALSPDVVGETIGIATIDVSFISLTRILPGVATVLGPRADVVALVKPQFEVGRGEVGRGGLVKDPGKHRAAVLGVARRAQEMGYAVVAAAPSPLTGSEGNREFFLHLVRTEKPPRAEDVTALVDEAVGS